MKFLKFSFLFLSIIIFSRVQAATLNVVPSSTITQVGKTGSITIMVSTPGQAINAVSGTLTFPKNLLEITSISKTGSFINFWVNEPKFSNSTGIVSFEGVALNPGFTGNSGKIIKINFKAKNSGKASLTLSNASVLANDGNGTNVLENMGQGSITIKNSDVEVVSSKDLPQSPIISSETHPDQTKWYSDNKIKAEWELPKGITKVYTTFDKKSDSVPTKLKTGSQKSFELANVKDGIWYIHTRLKNDIGVGPTGHFEIKIDTTVPDSFAITENNTNKNDNTKATLNILATDALSGIDKYSFIIDKQEPIEWVDDGSHMFTTNVLAPGSHTITGAAFDKAGNSTDTSFIFETTELIAPVIDKYKEIVKENENYEIGGKAFSGSTVKVFIKNIKNEKESILETKTNSNGEFSVSGNDLSSGEYNVYAVSYIENKYESAKSNLVKISSMPVGLNWIFYYIKYGLKWIISAILSLFVGNLNFLIIIVGILCLVFLILIILTIIKRHKENTYSKEPSIKAKHSPVDSVHPSLVINHAINTQQAILDKIKSGKNFSTDERHFLMQLRRDLDYLDSVDKPQK